MRPSVSAVFQFDAGNSVVMGSRVVAGAGNFVELPVKVARGRGVGDEKGRSQLQLFALFTCSGRGGEFKSGDTYGVEFQ